METGRAPRPAIEFAILRQQAADLLADLRLGHRFAFDALHHRVELRCNRRIELIGFDQPAAALHGLWISGPSTDYICYPRRASPLHQRVVIAHEYAHMLYGERPRTTNHRTIMHRLLPHINPPSPDQGAVRAAYTDETERRAELFATLVEARLNRWSTIRSSPTTADLATRIAAVLER